MLRWLFSSVGYSGPLDLDWADLGRHPKPLRRLPERIHTAVELYPCEILFIHRDAETATHRVRKQELATAIQKASLDEPTPAVFVVPVRMTEAWLLFDEPALRFAAGRPSGRHALNMPKLQNLEGLADPKSALHRLLVEASGTTGRRRRRFPVHERVHRMAALIEDFTPLRALSAFGELEHDLRDELSKQGWL